PLAELMRPSQLEAFVGQDGTLGEKSMLRKLIASNSVPSMILWGPPGCGKTTLAHIISQKCKESSEAHFVTLSATSSGVKDVKDTLERARNDQRMFKRKTVLFIDEIHRFNKLQQLVGLCNRASPIVSLLTNDRPGVLTLKQAMRRKSGLAQAHAGSVTNQLDSLHAFYSCKSFSPVQYCFPVHLFSRPVLMEEEALDYLTGMCDGDARTALNALQTAVEAHRSSGQDGCLTKAHVKEGLHKTHFLYDRAGDQHYNTISAFIKSMRGSDQNAALYYLACMLTGGEDPRFIARRLVIFASEDIGTHSLRVTNLLCWFHVLSLQIILAHCTTYCARAPKSRESYNAYAHAEKAVQEQERLPPVPLHLRNNTSYTSHSGQPHRGQSKELPFLPEPLKHLNFFDH
ncbi:werner helicase interacting protein, putative, partial [Ixodes scapularis]|uniref:Werner helicase interacting protein, putative n=2 Tax=Ixodes scapularis TaxID=6945 RepID=A0A1S4LUH7_IXOSC